MGPYVQSINSSTRMHTHTNRLILVRCIRRDMLDDKTFAKFIRHMAYSGERGQRKASELFDE